MFRLIEPSSGQIQNVVLVHSMSTHIMGSHTEYNIILYYTMYNIYMYYTSKTYVI